MQALAGDPLPSPSTRPRQRLPAQCPSVPLAIRFISYRRLAITQKTLEELFAEEELFADEIKDLFDAEKQLTKALPQMAKGAGNDALREAFESHLEETKQHVNRLEEVFSKLDKPARGKKCKAMAGLVEEGADLIKENAEPTALDAGLIGAAEKVEHYEIASYGMLANWARTLGHDDVAKILDTTLAEEKAADDKLTEIAASLNAEAAHGK